MKQSSLLLILAVLVINFASCKDKKTDQLTSSIPATAINVIHYNTKALIQKAHYNPLDNKMLKKFLDEQKNRGGKDGEMMGHIETLIKKPNSFGIDLIDDSFLYIDKSGTGILWKVNDAKKLRRTLTETFEIPEEMLEEKDGITIMEPSWGIVVAWTKEKLLFFNQTRSFSGGSGNLKEQVIKQLKQGAEESIQANKSFQAFLDNKKDISIFYSYENAMNLWDVMALQMPVIQDFYSSIKELADGINYGFFVSFEKGEVATDCKIYYKSDEDKEKYMKLMDQYSQDLKVNQLRYFKETPLFVLSTGLKGSGLFQYYKESGLFNLIDEETKEKLSQAGVDLEAIISNIEGDVTFAIHKMIPQGKNAYGRFDKMMPEATLLVDLKDGKQLWNTFTEIVEKAGDDLNIQNTGSDAYLMTVEDMVFYLGLSDNTLYITNREAMLNDMSNTQMNEFASLAKGKKVFMYGSLDPIKPMLLKEAKDPIAKQLAEKWLNLLGDYSFAAKNVSDGEGKLIITDKSDNSLAVFCKLIDESITLSMEGM
ncbi:DUF4836 family protein [Bacteroides sp. 224]|uniref:DUF4836 family protein n=1 Tax=Bacteroides sp. 224 TaxID=2302936 RepID=UPI0013D00C25|nr:DUF4836 family protein [Bacteroides sp. 224]NDV66302.1 DUF4836 family protein [Bacteroides sp. 224]